MVKIFCFLPLLGIHLFLFAPPTLGQEGDAESSEEKDFLEYYYQDPNPDRFVAQMKDWAEDGTLDSEHARPVLVSFISQLIRANRGSVSEWFDGLSGLTPGQKQVLFTGMLYSRTTEADEVLRNTFGEKYDEQKIETQKILEMPLDKEATVDMLWGFYYATGSESPIRRIVLCFRFQDAPEKLDGVDIPNSYVPYYKILPEFAYNSLLANAERHPRLVEILENFLKTNKSLLPPERNGVYDILSEINPDKYPPADRKGESV